MIKKTLILKMSILTATMSNITIIEYLEQSACVTCIIEIKESHIIICHVYHLWVPKGEGKLIIRFKNSADFRTIVIVDMEKILSEISKKLADIGTVQEVRLYDQTQNWTNLEAESFMSPWIACNNALRIDEKMFNLQELHAEFTLNDFDESEE